MNAFGDAAEHSILSGMPEQLSARAAIDPRIKVSFPDDAPRLAGRPGLARLFRLADYMRRFDLVLSYNWGAFDAVMAAYLFGRSDDFPSIVHHEDGFNEDEAHGLKKRRNLYRRLGLSAVHRLVVPSQRLEEIALGMWAQPAARIERIANGIAVGRFAEPAAPDAIPGFERKAGEVVIGSVAGLRAVKNLPRLVRAFAAMRVPARLVIVGEGPEHEAILAETRRLGIEDRVHLPGFIADPARYLGLFDIFALSSDSEQLPISLIEAMAAALPVAATAVGDLVAMLPDSGTEFLIVPQDEAGLAAALDRLASDPVLRSALGAANRAKARRDFNEATMISHYARLYGEAIGAPDAFALATT